MFRINTLQTDLEKTVDMIHKIFAIDVAVFDLQSRLIACTNGYLRQKGKSVHAPSIEEVIANTNVVVNKPGHMPTCQGCRFLGGCPAKIEILRSIRVEDSPVGVITFTSFSREGHERITNRLQDFVDTLNHFADWISQLVMLNHSPGPEGCSDRVLEAVMGLTRESVLVFNPDGSVERCSASAGELFSFCDLYTRSIYHILPEPVADKIIQGSFLKDTRLKIDNTPVRVSAEPVLEDDELKATAVLIRESEGREKTRVKVSVPARATNHPGISLENLLGNSPDIRKIKQKVKKLSSSSSTVLITGETGTGKGLLAKVIHFTGVRASGPFVPVNCTSIPETLFESELFGYEEGAFTGAKKGGKPGRFELAEGGTLFLDEIGEMPLHLQVKLLNVLQDHAFQRVGGVSPISMDVRIIAATNQDLDVLVKGKKFRADLYYRLNVIPIQLPVLARRKPDIQMLATAFLQESNWKAGKEIHRISTPVLELFHSYNWPGNIRELQNIIEYSVNMEETDTISPASLPENFLKRVSGHEPHMKYLPVPAEDIKSRVMMTEREVILSSLDRNGHDVRGKTQTARELGISLRTLYRKLRP